MHRAISQQEGHAWLLKRISERGEKRPDRASKPFVGPKGEADQGFLSSIDRGRPKPWTPVTTNHVATNTCRAVNG